MRPLRLVVCASGALTLAVSLALLDRPEANDRHARAAFVVEPASVPIQLVEPPELEGEGRRSEAPGALFPFELRGREHLAELAVAIDAGDPEAASALVRAWFEDGSSGLEHLWEVAGSEGLTDPDGAALGTLLKAATYYATHDPERLGEWTLDGIADAAVAMLGASDQVPAMLAFGLDQAGPRLDGRHLAGLVRGFADRDVGPVGAQIHCHRLMRTWATSMDASAAAALDELVRDETASDSERAQSAAALLLRDWRAAAPALVDGLASGTIPASGEVGFLVGAHLNQLDREEYAPYLAALGENVGLVLGGVWAMDADDAALALDGADAVGLPDGSRDLLAVRVAGSEAIAAGERLLALPMVGDERESLELFVFKSWLRTDAAVDGRFLDLAASRFEARASNPDRFWRMLGVDLDHIDDAHVMGGVLPFIERSRGERSTERAELVARLQRRFEGLTLE
ncbi:MAG: hypothetical protein AAGA20_12765 [Planctomycetota bacterium]